MKWKLTRLSPWRIAEAFRPFARRFTPPAFPVHPAAAARGFSEPGAQGTAASSSLRGEVLVRKKPGVRIAQVLSRVGRPDVGQEETRGMRKNTVRLG